MFNGKTTPAGCRLRVGTSGYSYAEWVDAGFYPPGTEPSRMLAAYARHFSITELNYTWYQMPKARCRRADAAAGAGGVSLCRQADPLPDP